jgi:hypothetical protein
VRKRALFERGDMAIWREEGEKGQLRMRRRGRRMYADLLKVEKVLKGGDLAEEDTVRDRVRGEEGGGEMVRVACFSGMRTEPESVCVKRQIRKNRENRRKGQKTY